MLKESADKIYINAGNLDILNLITSPSSRILDVGCGGGALAKILFANGHVVDGITISEKEYDAGKEYLNMVFIHNLEMGLPDALLQVKYDYVICSHVLEHIVSPTNLLKDIYRVLKPGAFILIALPNIMHFKSRMKLIAGKFEYEDAGIWDNTHVKWYTFETANRLLTANNFTIELATVTGDLPWNSLFSKVFSASIRKRIFNILIRISKGFFGYQILIKAKKG